MSVDFTIGKYRDLCNTIVSAGYTPLTVRAYLETDELPSRVVVVRHDVDSSPRNECMMASAESSFGIGATYYFRYKHRVFRPDVMREIAGMGHEIGYHYETLDRAKGDFVRAMEIFKYELAVFREVVDVRTISMHGNPLTRWDNRDLWRNYDFREFGITGEAYLSFGDIAYLTDTGRTWGPKYKVKDWLPPNRDGKGPSDIKPTVRSTDDVIEMMKTGRYGHLYLNTHAERWAVGAFSWAASLAKDTSVNIAKRGLFLRARMKRRAD